MNLQNLNTLIAHLEATPPERFNMAEWYSRPGKPRAGGTVRLHIRPWRRVIANWCGTAACIAGRSNYARGARCWYGWEKEADWLGLTLAEGHKLFQPEKALGQKHYSEDSYYTAYAQYTLTRALRTLRHMRDHYMATGEVVVDWDRPATPAAPPAPEAPSGLDPARVLGRPSDDDEPRGFGYTPTQW